MKKRASLISILILSFLTSIIGQTPSPATQQDQSDDEVVRITTNLVQVDAIVTDKTGKQVTDLRADEFEILEDGKPQAITNFSYVETGAEAAARSTAPLVGNAPVVAPVRLRPEQVRRTIILVADDLGLSFESVVRVRDSMKKFVNEKLQPGDLVAITRTGAGAGALQQLTTNKQQLLTAIDRIRWSFYSRVGITNFGPGSRPPSLVTVKGVDYSLDALSFILKGLKGLPGRKSVVFFTDDFAIFPSIGDIDLKLDDSGKPGNGMDKALNKMDEMLEKGVELSTRQKPTAEPGEGVTKMLDRANQASAVIYMVDTRGLPILSVTAEMSKAPPSMADLIGDNSLKLYNTQLGLRFIAEQTGGTALVNNNDIDLGLQHALDDLKGYYLIGYRPSEATFGRSRFHKISIRVKRPGLKVRSRKGFFGLTEEERRAAPRTRSEELIAAMTSPFQTGEINLRLTSLFSNDPNKGSFMRSLLHVDAKALKFQADSEGWQTARMEVAAMTFDDSGKIVDQVTRTETIQVRGASYERLLRNGLVYSFDVPVKKPGSYQLRIGVRDPETKSLGAASQFIEVPDLKKNRLTLSGIYARGIDPSKADAYTTKTSSSASGLFSAPPEIGEAAGTNGGGETGVQPGAATRRLRRGMALDYSFFIFNPQVDKSTRRPYLQTQLTLFRDGRQVFVRNERLFDANTQLNLKRIEAGGRLELGADMPPGEYILQVTVTDTLADEKSRTATQWIDFEIVK
jgi:VWFA-related protein